MTTRFATWGSARCAARRSPSGPGGDDVPNGVRPTVPRAFHVDRQDLRGDA